MTNLPDIIKAPWWSKEAVGQMGPAIVVLFVLLSVVVYSYVGPIYNLTNNFAESVRRDEQILDAVNLGNHYQWANCVNGAKDEEALKRCIPPPAKRVTESQAYMLETPASASHVAMRFFPRAFAAPSETGSTVRITPRVAEQRAEEQEQARLRSLREQGLDIQ